jgi:hypothetical protein
LSQNGPAQGGEVQEYVDISSRSDVGMGHFGQIPAGRQNGFHLETKFPWKGIQPSLREFPSDMFANLPPRRCG